MQILYLTARPPIPPLKGDQVRSYHQLRSLARRHEITLVTFCGPDLVESPAGELEELCRKVVRIPHDWRRRLVQATLPFLRRRWPLQVGLYHSRAYAQAVRDHLSKGRFDVVHAQLSRICANLPPRPGIPVVCDFVDALSLNMERRARQERPWIRPFAAWEASRMHRWETALAARFDRSVVVSEVDRAALGTPDRVSVVPNGVDLERFSYRRDGRKAATIAFSGNMSYFPNVDAAEWFADRVLPRVLDLRPDAEFLIAGANPHARLRRIADRNPAVVLTGFVPRMEQVLQAATLAVAPMRSGTGIQNKVIEAMAAGLPAVVSNFAMGGLRAVPGTDLELAGDEESFAKAVVRLLDDPQERDRLAANARKYVEREHSWEHSVHLLEQAYGLALGS